jgi:hypothetical protein
MPRKGSRAPHKKEVKIVYGGATDAIRGNFQEAALIDSPVNRFIVYDNLLGFNTVRCSNNHKERLASLRNIPFMAINKPQTVITFIQDQDEQVFGSGGRAIIPNAGIWAK